jgi:hypothetical protein
MELVKVDLTEIRRPRRVRLRQTSLLVLSQSPAIRFTIFAPLGEKLFLPPLFLCAPRQKADTRPALACRTS